MIEHGNYADFEILPDGNLKISLTPEGKIELEEISFNLENQYNDYDMLRDLIEYQLCNRWTWIAPESTGALTDAPILSNNVRYNNAGEIVAEPNVWWYPNYMIDDIIEKLYSNGYLIFDKA